jgi:hypothetical protein
MRLAVDSSAGVTVIILNSPLVEPKRTKNLLQCITEKCLLQKSCLHATRYTPNVKSWSRFTFKQQHIQIAIADSVVVQQQPSLHVILDVGGLLHDTAFLRLNISGCNCDLVSRCQYTDQWGAFFLQRFNTHSACSDPLDCSLPLTTTYLSMAVQPFVGPWPLFSFLILYAVGRTPWTGDQPVSKPLPVHRTTQTQHKRTQTYMPRVGFKPTTIMFERANTVHALDRAVTVIG